ncbi:type II toxin-antitoxin system HipA family toxin (plasmid) [Labrenzia sp. 5N]|jgi:serine/threonine-protein kinase HipA|uniref:type II toxin-antitoxin system HipA family toxin n=1 Tax=Stappiaceae TaxID=2821832 RepID=UPI00094B2C4B|nr:MULTISPECIES: type II toxin-antitoxin system HipA family toxin [Stappiaceae]MBO9463311.1 type II toxin-antitoxin system HipA family toxin [Labrenzia sp. R5_0]NKX68171.1 type II toxin-antitoxin system HipA family toxin [Labrenzia sp. 5N]UES53826.1 type II toxin-antitoxin system HipA family toxin [Roseibium aggregatum]UFI06712.1 type II toxin-antitoxin system HipA family toxin [Roseibium aggregatum]
MAEPSTDASINLWGREIAAVSWLADEGYAVFQYDPEFSQSGIELSPLVMPLSQDPYSFPALPRTTFKGLPGMLADALPDKYGDRLINAWLAEQGRTPESFNPVERLCYVGTRGMGALEFKPALMSSKRKARKVEVANLVRLANLVLNEKASLEGVLEGKNDLAAIDDILRVGTSAGGARAKAILAWNQKTGEFRHGQIDAGDGFEHWLMKFDGIDNNRDKEEPDPQGFGLIEYGYYLMATAAGIDMMPCRLHHEGGRSHFMTRRFDRPVDENGVTHKLHMQSLCALQHYDFNDPRGYSYEQAILTIRELGLGAPALEQQFLRAIFNIIARNQDDHVKNIAFLMDQTGEWTLSPAFDVNYSYNPSGEWTGQHQMSLNGKRDGFEMADLLAFAETASIKPTKAKTLISNVSEVVSNWPKYAQDAGVNNEKTRRIRNAHRSVL